MHHNVLDLAEGRLLQSRMGLMEDTPMKRIPGILGGVGSWLAGVIAVMVVFGLVLALAWAVTLREEPSLRLMGTIVGTAVGLYAGGLVVGLLGRSDPVKRSLAFTLIFSMIGFTYIFAFSQITLLLTLAGGSVGLLSGETVRKLKRTDR